MGGMRPTLLLVALVACGTPQHAFNQGVPVAPRAPTFNPTWDAPITTGQPGYIGSPERAPRGTDARVLPPTREPGIWASSGAGDVPPTASPSILGVSLPIAWPQDEYAKAVPSLCAEEFDEALEKAGVKHYLGGLTEAQRRCAVAGWYAQCTARQATAAERFADSAQAKSAANAAKHLAQRFMDEACDGVTFELAEKQAVNSVLMKWLTRGAR